MTHPFDPGTPGLPEPLLCVRPMWNARKQAVALCGLRPRNEVHKDPRGQVNRG